MESCWREVCHETVSACSALSYSEQQTLIWSYQGHYNEPREVTINHCSKDHQGGEEYDIPVRIRQPLELPFTSREARDFVYPLHQNNKTHLVPQSAIFFASRFHRLRELVRKLEIAKSGLEDPRRGHRERAEFEQRKQESLKEIYSVLLSASLYLAAMLRSNAEASRDGGRDRLEYYASTWLEVYEKGTARGSEVFGMKDGFGLNGEFLLKHRKEWSVWSEEAIDWWCPNTSDRNLDRVNRVVLKNALNLLKKELFEMFAGMVSSILIAQGDRCDSHFSRSSSKRSRDERRNLLALVPSPKTILSLYLLPLLPMSPPLVLESYISFCG